MDDAEIKKNAEFLTTTMSGMEVPGAAKLNIRYKPLLAFNQVYGLTDPKYVGPEEDGIIACHAFAKFFTVKALYKLLLGMKLEQDGEVRPFLLNPGKLLHAGQKYDWEGCADVKNGDDTPWLQSNSFCCPGDGAMDARYTKSDHTYTKNHIHFMTPCISNSLPVLMTQESKRRLTGKVGDEVYFDIKYRWQLTGYEKCIII